VTIPSVHKKSTNPQAKYFTITYITTITVCIKINCQIVRYRDSRIKFRKGDSYVPLSHIYTWTARPIWLNINSGYVNIINNRLLQISALFGKLSDKTPTNIDVYLHISVLYTSESYLPAPSTRLLSWRCQDIVNKSPFPYL